MAERVVLLKYNENELIFREGDNADGIFFIKEGCVQTHSENYDYNVIFAGNFFGEFSIIGDEKRSLSVTSITHTELLFLTKRDFWDIA
ncbi:MAG: cyclic nucleotide-binding domain-containing protein, partial [Bacteroidales bacterium]